MSDVPNKLTVGALIERLKTFDPSMHVVIVPQDEADYGAYATDVRRAGHHEFYANGDELTMSFVLIEGTYP